MYELVQTDMLQRGKLRPREERGYPWITQGNSNQAWTPALFPSKGPCPGHPMGPALPMEPVLFSHILSEVRCKLRHEGVMQPAKKNNQPEKSCQTSSFFSPIKQGLHGSQEK